MAVDAPTLTVRPRAIEGSRATRRLRRTGAVPGVLYGGTGEPVPFTADGRELRIAMQRATAVVELSMDGETTPALLKDVQRHPVRGEAMHVDFLRVRMDVAVQAPVALELHGADEAPGTSEGGVLEQTARELTIEALPGDIPESIVFDASHLEAGATVTVADVTPPPGVTLIDDPETVVASITLPRLEVEAADAVEEETEVVGEGEGEAFAGEGSHAEAHSETPGAGSGDAQTPSG